LGIYKYYDESTSQWISIDSGAINDGIERVDVARYKTLEDQVLVSQNQQDVTIPHGVSVIETDRKTPLEIKMDGRTLTNHPGKQGGFYSQFNRWDANLTIDTATYFSGTSSGKIDNSAGTVAKKSLNSQKMHLSGKKVILGIHAKSASGTPSIAVRLYGYDGADALITTKTLTATITNVFGIYYAKFDLSANTDVYWKAELEVTSFGTAADVVNFDDMITYSLSTTDFDKLDILSNDEVAERYGYIDSVKHIQNPVFVSYGKNHISPFTQDWSLHANASVVIPYELEHVKSTTGSVEINTIYLPSIGGESYTVSSTVNISNLGGTEGAYIDIGYVASDGSESWLKNTNKITSSGTLQATVTLPSDAVKIRIKTAIGSDTTGTFTFTNPQLELGSTATTFEAQNKTYLYGAYDSNKNPISLGSNLDGSVADRLYYHEGWKVLKRWEKDVVLDGSLGWSFNTDNTGYKIVKIVSAYPNAKSNTNEKAVKYDGKIIPLVVTKTAGDQVNIGTDGTLYISIADTDSGWTDAMTGTTITSDFIKGLANGWKYTGDGTTHSWAQILDATVTSTSATFIADPANKHADWEGWGFLSYQLADSVVEPVTMEGALNLVEGLNQVELTEGVIVREKVSPQYHSDLDRYYIGFTFKPESQPDYRVNEYLEVYRELDADKKWIKGDSNSAYGNEKMYIPASEYDDTKSYYTSYLLLDKHLFTANAIEAEGTYNTNLKTVVDKHTDQIADQGTRLSIVENEYARKGQGAWISPTLLNGWVNYDTSLFEGVGYYIDDMGVVHLKGLIKNGTLNSPAFILPSGYRSKLTLIKSTIASNAGTVAARLDINKKGEVKPVDGGTAWFSLNNISFRAEQ
jgi:hypothetical protein